MMTGLRGISVSNSSARDMPIAPPLRDEEFWPHYAADEIAAVDEVLRSGRINQWTGDTVFAFEEACTRRFGGGHGIALANGSLALELALLAFGIGEGDEVIVTPRTFVASAFCVRMVGATPVFADIDADSGNVTPFSIAAVLTERTKAIIPVHLAGWPADMAGIMDLAGRHDLKVIEDCAQAHGATIDGGSVGSFGDAAAFSFCQDKIISTGGEGGFTSFKDSERWEWAWSFKDHGKSREKVFAPQSRHGFRWLHDSVGTNWRLTGMQAAIGLKQLEKLDTWKAARAHNAAIWSESLEDVSGIRTPRPAAGIEHAYYKYYFYLEDRPDAGALRDEILVRGAEAGLRVFSGSCSEVYLEKAFDGAPPPDLPVARAMTNTSLMVEVHPTLKAELVRQRAQALAEIVQSVLSTNER
jgi:dTDP-4-amino-4,6-dideoxygalactose transaminase